MNSDRADEVLGRIRDLVADFTYYDRKEDEELPVGEIEEAVAAGEVTVEELVQEFDQELRAALGVQDKGVAK